MGSKKTQHKFYVYQHIRLDSGTIFYVGKGQKYRAYDKNSRNRRWNFIVNKAGYRAEIVKSFEQESEAFDFEIQLIAKYKEIGLCEANFAIGGQGASGCPSPMRGKRHSQTTKDKISKARKGIPAWNKGKKGEYSKEYREKIAMAKCGVKLSKEHKAKICKNSKTDRPIEVYSCNCVKFRKRGQPSIYKKDKLIARYPGIAKAARDLNIPHQWIFRVLNGSRKQCKGMIFEYEK